MPAVVQRQDVDVGLLGPVELSVGAERVSVAGGRQRLILAALAMRPGYAVGRQELIETLWGDDPPDTAWRQVQNAVSLLRRVLDADTLRSEPDGYRLAIRPDQVDLGRFRAGVAEGRRLAGAGEPAAAAQALRDALDLWRGPALAGLSGVIERHAAHLAEERLAAQADRVEYELAAGGGDSLIVELATLVAENPLHERLAATLMTALYRSGRQAEALAMYRRVAADLADQLGVDPGPELRARYQEILNNQAEPEPERTTPAQLPAATPMFVGRERELRDLDRICAGPPGPVLISGTAGVGKTTLAVHWGRRVAGRFPDGQLYLNLRGFDPRVRDGMRPADAMLALLQSLGVPPQRIPARFDAQAALYRSVLADRRVLVVLDNVRDADQVRPLLPAGAGCRAVITSRHRLPSLVALEGAQTVALDLPTLAEARSIVGRRLGPERMLVDTEVVDEIIGCCARLPLALAIVAARVAHLSSRSLAEQAGQLHASRGGLDVMDGGDQASNVRAVFSWSYRALGSGAARLFRLLAVHPGPDLTAPAAASLAGLPAAKVRPLLTELADANLIAEHQPGRFTSHDLLRAYAAEVADRTEPAPERAAAQARMVDHYLHSTNAANLALRSTAIPVPIDPPVAGTTPETFDEPQAALAWVAAERPVIMNLIQLSVGPDLEVPQSKLCAVLADVLHRDGRYADLVTSQSVLLAVSERRGDLVEQGRAHRALAMGCTGLGRYDDAYEHLRRALAISEELGDVGSRALIHHIIGSLLHSQQRLVEGLVHIEQSAVLYRAVGNTLGEAKVLSAAGWFQAMLGEGDRAVDTCQRAIVLAGDDAYVAASAWDTIGFVHYQAGRYPAAVNGFQRSLVLLRQHGGRHEEGSTHGHLGDAYAAMGDHGAARVEWQRALDVLEDIDHPDVAGIRAKLAASAAPV